MGIAITRIPAQVIFFENFNSEPSEDYHILKFDSNRDGVQFAFDYGALGIPIAPNSPDSDTTGVQLWANNPAPDTTNSTSAVQVIRRGIGRQLVEKSYRLSFDVWMNVNGPLPDGGAGSTEAFMVGVGWNGAKAIEVGQQNGTYFSVTGEGGVATDVRVFTSNGFNPDGALASPTPDLSDDYFKDVFPGGVDVGALPVQGGQDAQTGTTQVGQMAFQWHEVDVEVRNGAAKFFVDNVLFANATETDLDGSIMIGYADFFASESDAPQWSFGIMDNLRVAILPRGDFNRNEILDVIDLDALLAEVREAMHDPEFDLNDDLQVDALDRDVWVRLLKNTFYGDSNLDGEFNSSDLIRVFQAGKYELAADATWETGDWNGDGKFSSGDLVLAFADGGYELGPRDVVRSVPEPSTSFAILLLLVLQTQVFRQSKKA